MQVKDPEPERFTRARRTTQKVALAYFYLGYPVLIMFFRGGWGGGADKCYLLASAVLHNEPFSLDPTRCTKCLSKNEIIITISSKRGDKRVHV